MVFDSKVLYDPINIILCFFYVIKYYYGYQYEQQLLEQLYYERG
jgi:hypothetical protein